MGAVAASFVKIGLEPRISPMSFAPLYPHNFFQHKEVRAKAMSQKDSHLRNRHVALAFKASCTTLIASTSKMRILIQNCKNRRFYRADGAWVVDSAQALNFESSINALEFCRHFRANDVQIIMKFTDSRYDLSVPVSEGCRGPDLRER
jgi:hypothetical protein